MKIGILGRESWEKLLVTDIGTNKVVLGMDWLRKHNPDITGQKGK